MGSFTTSITLSGLSMLYGDDLSGLIETARQAEAAGIDQVVITDHLAIGPRTDLYPYGRFPFGETEPWPEPLTTLAVIAGATKHLRLGTGVLIAPIRPALLLAKTLATLDVLSAGRLDVGVGTGWQREEFDAAGVPFEERGARLDDLLGACAVLWRDAPATYESKTVRFENIHCHPHPIQSGGPPIWFGMALSERNLARMARHGRGWMPITSDTDTLKRGVEQIAAALESVGRAPSEVGVRGVPEAVTAKSGRVDLEATLDGIPALLAAGATQISLPVAGFVSRRDRVPAFLEALAARA